MMSSNFRFRHIALVILSVAASLSAIWGVRNALVLSKDFQWSPAALFVNGENPYEVYLSGNVDGEIILSQIPNYLHALYVLFIPFGLMDFGTAKLVWAITNLMLAVLCVALVQRLFQLSNIKTLILLLVFLLSTPVRNTIGNGQHGLLVFVLISLPFIRNSTSSWLGAGMGLAKYSFGPPFALFYLLRFGVLRSALMGVVPITGWLAFSVWTGTSPIETMLQPVLVSSSAVGLGQADIMSLTNIALGDHSIWIADYLTASVLTILLVWFAGSIRCHKRAFVLVCVSTLITFKHLSYDMLFLLPLAGWAIMIDWKLGRAIAAVTIIWTWFGLRILPVIKSTTGFELPQNALTVANFLLLLVSFIVVYVEASRIKGHYRGGDLVHE